MGLFDKLKANMTHGGVKVQVQAPASVPSNEVIPVQVTLTADSEQTVASVKVELKAKMQEQGISFGSGVSVGESTTSEQTVAVAESRQAISLNAGQPQTVTLQLYLSGNTSAVGVLSGIGNGGGALGGVLQTVMAATQAFNHTEFIYTIHAYADVEGIAMDPSDKQFIQILPAVEHTQPVSIAAPTTPYTNPTEQVIPPSQ